MNLNLSGRTALVCGSTQGIGKAAAIELALLGANVILMARNENTLREVVVGAKFVPMFHRSSAGSKTILEVEKLNSYVPADIDFAFTASEKEATS